ncbi:glutamyl-tRNA reductase [Ravibacter arvi]|uniref:Glutamyl-tRNA reductase n=1 Tax=Ravibacter arvi TaxID=2051041 RepID=A0ABP8LQA4_9BACT
MQSWFQVVSLTYHKAPLTVREKLALSEEEAKAFMLKVKEFFDVSDLLVVSTCNRTEVYVNAPQTLNEELAKLLIAFKGITDSQEYLPFFEFYEEGDLPARHLFEVATGLHSQVVGDMQVPNQIKRAYQASADLQLAGPYLHRLMHTIFFANKRVALETEFRDGAASVSYAAADLALSFMHQPKILVVGVGEIGEDVCKNLANRGTAEITIVNRTRKRADDVGGQIGGKVVDWENLDQAMAEADVIISTITRSEPLFTRERVGALGSLHKYKYFIDLSVPRSVEASLEELNGVVLYDIDAIKAKTDAALEKRVAAVSDVKKIIDDSVEEFNDWSKEMIVSPTINKLKAALEQIRREELSRYMKGLSENELAIVEKVTSSMMQKIIKLPVLQLKAACKRGEAETLIDVLNDLFNLEAQSESSARF